MANYLDLTGLQRLWGHAKTKFVAQPASATASHIATFTSGTETINGSEKTIYGIQDSGFTIATSVPANAVFTDYQATKEGHYTPGTADTYSVNALNTNLSWGAAVITEITKDNNGHIIGVTTTKLPANPVSANTVTASAALTNNEVLLGAGDKTAKTSGYTLGSATFSTAASGTDKILATEAGVKDFVEDAVAGLSGAMHFVGTASAAMTDLQTTNPTVSGVSSFAAGDVVIDSTETEFVLGKDSKWHKLGDANSYALADNVVNSWTGAGDEDSIITVTPNTATKGAVSASILHKSNYTANTSKGTSTKVAQISNDKYGHVTAISEVDIAFPVTEVAGKTGEVTLDSFKVGVKSGSTATDKVTYNGNGAKSLYFSSAAASTTNVQFAIDNNGVVTGTISEAAAPGNGALQIKGSAANAAATATGFTANSSSAGTITFSLGTGNALTGITTSEGTVTFNSATIPTELKNPYKLTITDGVSGHALEYDGSGSNKTVTFSSAASELDETNAKSTVKFTTTSGGAVSAEVALPANAWKDTTYDAEKGVVLSSGKFKAALVNETANSAASSKSTSTKGGLYAVELDKDGKLAVRVPWEDTNTYTTGVSYSKNESTNNVVATWQRTTGTYGESTDMPVAYGATADAALTSSEIDSVCN